MLLADPEQTLAAHLIGVANKAADFAQMFSAEEHGKLAGLLHDLGKAEPEFQKRIRGIDGDKQPHAHHGAALALSHDHWPVGFAVNGHHAGLHDRHDLDSMRGRRAYYAARATESCVAELKREGFNELSKEFGPVLSKGFEGLADDPEQQMHAVELYTRFLFSAVIDADRLDTEGSDPKAKAAAANRKCWRPFDARALLKQKSWFKLCAKKSVTVAA